MEMCYDGALVMPSSYAVMTEDEMTYVDGGISWETAAKVGKAIVSVCGTVGVVLNALNAAIKFGSTVTGMSESAFVKTVASKASAAVTRIVAWITKYADIILCAVTTILAGVGAYVFCSDVAKRIYKGK